MNPAHLKKQTIGILIALAIQYLLGMAVNLFVQFPDNQHGGQLWEFAWRHLPLALHIIIGLLLVTGSLNLLIRARKTKNQNWITASFLGFMGILLAALGGSRFIPTQVDFYSYAMAVGFLIAVFSYGWGIYKAKN